MTGDSAIDYDYCYVTWTICKYIDCEQNRARKVGESAVRLWCFAVVVSRTGHLALEQDSDTRLGRNGSRHQQIRWQNSVPQQARGTRSVTRERVGHVTAHPHVSGPATRHRHGRDPDVPGTIQNLRCRFLVSPPPYGVGLNTSAED